MMIIAHEMPDGSVKRTTSFEPTLAWLQAGRTPAEVEAFIAGQLAIGAPLGVKRSAILLLIESMQDTEGEIERRVARGQPREIAEAFVYAWRDGGKTQAEALDLIAKDGCWTAVRSVAMENTIPDAIATHYRSAFKLSGNALGWDIAKAREAHRARLRELRRPKFEPLERAQRTALATGNTAEAQRLETQLQALRDVTADPRIATAATVEELVSVIPDALK